MAELRGVSPASEAFSDNMDSLSMRDKSLLKRSASKHHNNNFTAGYIPVHEQHLQKTGLRGRKTFAFWILVCLLFILAIGNLILTMTILGVLRLGQGMQSLELVPDNSAIKLYGNTDLNDIYKRDGRLEGFQDYPVEITGLNGSIIVKLAQKNGRPVNKLLMDKNGTVLRNINSFIVKNEDHVVFTTSSPTYNIIKKVNSLNSRMMQTSRIVSPIMNKLQMEAKHINLVGAEGTSMDTREIHFTADQDVYLKSLNGSIIFDGKEVLIDGKRMPIVLPKLNENMGLQYKVCVCMPLGKLFKVPVSKDHSKTYCDHINLAQYNPCI